jgi:hypothetical protein
VRGSAWSLSENVTVIAKGYTKEEEPLPQNHSPQAGLARDYNPALSRIDQVPDEGQRSLKTRDSALADPN